MPSVRLPAFAKINLCLRVLGKRPDGYHELRTIFQTISLHDDLHMELTRSPGLELALRRGSEISDKEAAGLQGPANLVRRALEALRREFGIRRGVRVELTKRIPIGRGLGGGSSDAAAALIGFLRLTRRSLPGAELAEIAAGLGADVPFFLVGGRALGVGRGDEVYPLPDGARRTVLVISPRDIGVSTREAYTWVRRQLTKRGATSKLWRFCALCWSPQEPGLLNDFETAVFRRHPRLGRIKAELLRQGAVGAALAGSGSAVFGVFRSPAQARRAAYGFPKDRALICQTVSREQCRRALYGRDGV